MNMVNQASVVEMLNRISATTDVKKADITDKAQFPQFKEIMSQTMNKAASMNSVKANSYEKAAERNSPSEVSKPMKAYKDIAQPTKVETKQPAETQYTKSNVSDDKPKTEITVEKPDEDLETQGEVVADALAKVLGVKPEDLMYLLAFLHIKPQDLADQSKAGEIAQKLSDLIGLDGNQKNALTNIIQMASQKTAEVFSSKVFNERTQTHAEPYAEIMVKISLKASKVEDATKDWVKLPVKDLEVVQEKSIGEDISAIMSNLKVKLQEMVKQLESNPKQFENQISALMEEVIGQSAKSEETVDTANGMKVDVVTKPEELASSGDETGEVAVEKVARKADTKETAHHDSENAESDDSDQKPAILTFGNQAKETITTDNAVLQQNIAVQPVTKQDANVEIVKLHKEPPVSKNEIINQVVEKAKVLITPEKSEMVMDLKPDSLGKLTLKVVTENGMVHAKFVAENQQVKEVIESNFQLLKDTLERQGMAVQGFSVSVGQDSGRNMQQNGENRNTGGHRKINASNASGYNGTITAEAISKTSYGYTESSINLTA